MKIPDISKLGIGEKKESTNYDAVDYSVKGPREGNSAYPSALKEASLINDTKKEERTGYIPGRESDFRDTGFYRDFFEAKIKGTKLEASLKEVESRELRESINLQYQAVCNYVNKMPDEFFSRNGTTNLTKIIIERLINGNYVERSKVSDRKMSASLKLLWSNTVKKTEQLGRWASEPEDKDEMMERKSNFLEVLKASCDAFFPENRAPEFLDMVSEILKKMEEDQDLLKIKMEITHKTSPQDAAKIISLVTGIDFKPEEIALSSKGITNATKVYVGFIGPFLKEILQSEVEHIYNDSLERKILRSTVKLEGKLPRELKRGIIEAGGDVFNDAELMLFGNEFVTSNPEEVDLAVLCVADLGFWLDPPTTEQVYGCLEKMGLELCPDDVGPNWIIQHIDEQTVKDFYVYMKPIQVDKKHEIFNIDDDGGHMPLTLASYTMERWSLQDKLMVRFPKKH